MIYKTRGTCSSRIELEVDDNHIIKSVQFTGGCNGNLQGVSKLVVGRCGFRSTSCPDQLAKALKLAIAQ